jgi:phi13 family phage major tail protein
MNGGIQIGLSNLVYAKLTTDPASGLAVYEAPIAIPGVMSANMNPNPKTATAFGDNGPMEVASTLGEISLEISAGNIPLSVQAELLGHTYSTGIIVRKAADVAPWVAVGFKTLKSNGHYRYVWLTKGRFQEPEQKSETKGDSVNFQPTNISAAFVKRDCDDIWQLQTDEDDTGYVAAKGAAWFNAVPTV